MPENTPERAALLEHTTDIVSAYAGNNALASRELPELISAVFNTVSGLGAAAPEPKQEPAVPINKSVTKKSIVCLECGQAMKMIKRHLSSSHGLTPSQYREKWGLRPDYPMLSPEYSAMRSKLAQQIGLGRASSKRRTAGRKKS